MKPFRLRLGKLRLGNAKLFVLVGLVLVAYLAAINRVQSLPWALAALLMATLAVGVIWPHWLVKRLSVVRKGPTRAEEGETITFHVEVENQGRLPRFMVGLVDHLPFVGAAEGAVTRGETTLGLVAHVPGGGRKRFEVSLACEKRGFYRLGPVGLVSSFPLGLAEARQQHNEGVQTLTIYPDVFPVMALPLLGARSQIHRGGYLLPEGSGAAEFSGLREYRRGDNPRHIHWPTTARLNELMVKEFEPLASACICIVLDQAMDANIGKGRHASFEYSVRIAASIAKFACGNSIPVRLMGQGARALDIQRGNGEHHYQSLLEDLAIVEADGLASYASVLKKAALDCQHGETMLVFLSEPEANHADILQALALLRSKSANLFAVVFDRDSFLTTQAGKMTEGESNRIIAALHELGAYAKRIRNGDDLVRAFNA